MAIRYITSTGNSLVQIAPAGSGQVQLGNASLTTPIIIKSGTTSQHTTNFVMANTAATRSVTFPDADGTIAFTGALGAATATSITFSPTTSGIVGTTTNNDATAGIVGEYISSTVLVGSAVALTDTTPANITSISLTAGDWTVSANIAYAIAATTINTIRYGAISTTSATLPTIPASGAYFQQPISITGAATVVEPIGTVRVPLNSTTTVYLVVRADFTVSTLSAYGFIGARRMR